MPGAGLLFVLLLATCAGEIPPAARPGQLSRSPGLLGWGTPGRAETELPAQHKATAVVERFRERLKLRISSRLRAVESVQLSTAGRQHRRVSRSLPASLLTLDRDTAGVAALLKGNGTQKVWELPAPGAQHVHVFEDGNRTYALAAFGPGSETSWLYKLEGDEWTPLSNFSSFGAVQFTSFGHASGRYVISAEYDCTANRPDKRGSILYLFTEGRLQFQHVLPGGYPTDVAIWNDYDTFHIGVSSELEKTPGGSVNYHVNSSIFKWAEGNFRHHTLPTYGARDLEHFRIQSHSFLAVANHQNNDGSLNLHSEILRYSLGSGQYRPFQRLLTRGAVRFRHFSWGRGVEAEHFLAVANQADRDFAGEETNYRTSSVIYKFSQSQFVPFQCVPTTRARDVLPVWGPAGEFVLAFLDAAGLQLYQYTGWRFARVALVPLPPAAAGDGHGRLSAFTHRGHSHLTVGSAGGQQRPAVYRLQFGRRRDVHDLHSRCERWCAELKSDLDGLKPQLGTLRTQLERAPKVDQNVTFASLRVRSTRHVHFSRVVVDNVRLRENVTLNSGLLERLRTLKLRLERGMDRLDSLQRQMAGTVSIATNHTFTQAVTVTGRWHLNTASVSHLRLRRLNGIGDVTAFLSGLVWTDGPFTDLSAHLAFSRLRLQDGASLSVGTLSHTRPSGYVTLSGDHVITASKVFSGHVTAADLRAELVNGVRVTPGTALVQGRLPAGVTRFTQLTVSDLRVRRINDIDVQTVLEEAVSIDDQRLPVNVMYAGPVSIQSATIRSINGLPVQRLLEKAFTTAGGQNITGGWSVGRLHVDADLILTGTLSGLRVPEDLVLLNRPDVTYNVTRLSFSSVTVHQLTVTERLGPVRVFDGRLQLLLTSGDQLVVGKKTVRALRLAGNSSVAGSVNGVNISTALLETPLLQTTDSIAGDLVLRGDVIFLSDLDLTGRLNGVDVPRLLLSALRLTDTSLPAMQFSQLEISGDLRTATLNSMPPSEWVTSDGADQLISGDKALLSLSAASLWVDLLNGLSLDGLYDGLLRTEGDQRVQGPLLFAAETVLDRAVATSVSWQGYSLTEAVTLTGTHVISGTKLFSAAPQFSELEVTELWVDGLVDGVNVTSLLSRTAARVNTTSMTVSGSQRFTSLVTASTLVVTGSVNGEDLLRTLQDAVREALVTGDLTFDAPVTVQRLSFTGWFDGVSAAEFGSGWLTSAGGQRVSGPLRFSGGASLTASSLRVPLSGRLNGVLGGKLLDGRVPLGEPVDIRQNVTFKSLAAADLSLQMEGLNLSDAMRQNRSQIVLGAKLFTGGMFPLSRLTVNGTVNGVRLNDLCHRVVLKDAANAFKRLTVTGDVTLHEVSRPLSWTLNGVPLDRLASLYWLRDARQTLTGRLSLAGPYFAAVEGVQTLLSGTPATRVDLTSYLRNYWSLARPQTVSGDVIFTSDVTAGYLTAGRLAVSGLLNGEDPSALRDTVLTVHGGTVTGEWILPDLVITDELSFSSLSGVPGSALLRTSDTEARFTAPQTVRHLTVRGDVVLPEGGLVYHLDLSEYLELSDFLTRRPGPVEVNSSVLLGSETVTFTQPLTVGGAVNGVRVSRASLLTLSGAQRVPGVTVITHVGGPCLHIADLATPTINGIHLERLSNHAVRLHSVSSENDTALEVTGYWSLTHQPSLLGHRSSDSDTQQRITQLLREALWALQQLRQADRAAAEDHLSEVTDIHRAIQLARAQLRSASYLQYYVSLQRWRAPILRLLPVFLDGPGRAPAFLAAVWQDRLQLLRWRLGGGFGQWQDGPRYPERQVSCLAGLRRSDGAAHVAEARLAVPPPGVQVPDRVYRWDDPALRRLGDAVNYIFLYHRGVLTQSQAMPSHKTVDVKSLKPSPDHDCFLFVHFSGNASHLVCHSDSQRSFVVHQRIPTLRARQASVYNFSGSVCVAIAGGSRVNLWCWDAETARLVLRQTISAAAVGVDTALFHGRTLLAVTGAGTGKMAGLVDVYSLEPSLGQFSHLQTVPVWAVRSSRLLLLPSDELLLGCLTADGRLVYLHYRGPSGFEPRGQMTVGHAATVEMFNLDGLATQVTVAGRPPADMFALTEHYPAAVFAGKFMGHEW